MKVRTLFAIAGASICGIVGATAQEGVPQDGVYLQAQFLTMPNRTAEKLGLIPGNGNNLVQSVLSGDEFEKLATDLKKAGDVTFHIAPRILAVPDSTSIVEQIQEFRYPTEYEAPDFSRLPVTRTLTPTQFESRNVGLTVSFLPSIEKGGMIDLQVETDLVSFTDWIAYSDGKTVTPNGSKRPPGGFVLPVFSTSSVSAPFQLMSGETILMGGYPVLAEQTMNELMTKSLDQILSKKDKPGSQPDQLRFILITAHAPQLSAPAGDLHLGESVQLSTLLISIPREKAPKGFLTGAPGKSRSFNLKLLDHGVAENLLQRWQAPDMGVEVFEGPKVALSPEEEYVASASGLLAYPASEPKSPVEGEQMRLNFRARAKIETSSIINLEVLANLDQVAEKGDLTQPKVEWRTAANASGKPPQSKHTFADTKVAMGKGQTLLMASENSPNPDRVLFLFVKAVPSAKSP